MAFNRLLCWAFHVLSPQVITPRCHLMQVTSHTPPDTVSTAPAGRPAARPVRVVLQIRQSKLPWSPLNVCSANNMACPSQLPSLTYLDHSSTYNFFRCPHTRTAVFHILLTPCFCTLSHSLLYHLSLVSHPQCLFRRVIIPALALFAFAHHLEESEAIFLLV